MSWKGGFAAGDTVDFKFTTRRFNTGVPFTLAGTPAVSVYKSNSTTQSTSGITLTVDFDSVTGLNHVRIDTTSDGTFYANGSQFDVVITAGTVDSVSVVGEAIGRFELRAAVATASALATVQADTDDIQSRLPAALVSGRMDASVGAMAANVMTAAAAASDLTTELQAGLSTLDAAGVRAAVGLASANLDTQLSTIDDFLDTEVAAIKAVTDKLDDTLEDAGSDGFIFSALALSLAPSTGGDPWAASLPGAYGAGTAGKIVGDALDAAISTRATPGQVASELATYDGPTNAELATALAAADDAVLSAIGSIPSAPTATENADALLNRDMSAVSDTNARSPLNALRFLRNKWVLTSSTLSVKKENDVTEAWTAEVTTAPGADPISGSDPA